MIDAKESDNLIIHEVIESGFKLEETLKKELNISGRFFRKLIKNNSIYLENKDNKSKLNEGDFIYIKLEEEDNNYIPQNIPIDILYENFDLIIINKEPNIVVHPTKSHVDNTLANALSYYYKTNNINRKIRFVNRLDMDTSGILVIAKNSFGHQQMAVQFDENTIEKKYLAVVDGIVKNDDGLINEPIGKENEDEIKNKVITDGKECLTYYKVIERYKNASLLELTIKTGRTHQIRVHLSFIGHPIIGDTLYNKVNDIINRQALHSHYLKFTAPRTKETIEIKAELPQDMKNLIKSIK